MCTFALSLVEMKLSVHFPHVSLCCVYIFFMPLSAICTFSPCLSLFCTTGFLSQNLCAFSLFKQCSFFGPPLYNLAMCAFCWQSNFKDITISQYLSMLWCTMLLKQVRLTWPLFSCSLNFHAFAETLSPWEESYLTPWFINKKKLSWCFFSPQILFVFLLSCIDI